ncbi:hypothetical protein GCM10020218_105080 [Dactylosporangium vinaceum]
MFNTLGPRGGGCVQVGAGAGDGGEQAVRHRFVDHGQGWGAGAQQRDADAPFRAAVQQVHGALHLVDRPPLPLVKRCALVRLLDPAGPRTQRRQCCAQRCVDRLVKGGGGGSHGGAVSQAVRRAPVLVQQAVAEVAGYVDYRGQLHAPKSSQPPALRQMHLC